MSIRVAGITKLYGQQKALDNVSFTINTGEITGFLGPNGAGKSTMMKILTGFIPPNEGSAFINDLDILQNGIETRRLTGYLPENNPLYPDMYIREYLLYVARLYKIPAALAKKKVEEMIERTGLLPEHQKKIGALSKGYRQRVGLAQALIHDPEVLILDEPTSGLDPNQIVEIRSLISDLGKKKTVMLSTHIMQEVESICNRVIIINEGRIVEDGAIDKLQSRKETGVETIIVEFSDKVSRTDIEAIQGIIKIHGLKDNQWLIQSQTTSDIRPVLFNLAVKKGITVLSMQKKEKTLEEVFQELTVNKS
ncbi:MAG: gliding motility-associated ABC transporter ATP-binding subunit GldA [Bacteroidetes bacterium HGW-Bacteroidetes-21]|jgi:ABC-2 type transport system ATP-binding protein|nr:MAG: gliding motility-associated ABC transporter ATP-binding subunit GldA [Bacteroidetes bacterium HGW-Bacteroidetes-21]